MPSVEQEILAIVKTINQLCLRILNVVDQLTEEPLTSEDDTTTEDAEYSEEAAEALVDMAVAPLRETM